jgi:hypothetical protein
MQGERIVCEDYVLVRQGSSQGQLNFIRQAVKVVGDSARRQLFGDSLLSPMRRGE